MIKYIVKKIVRSQNDRAVKKLWPVVNLINEHESALQAQPEGVLRHKTAQWRAELAKIEDPAAWPTEEPEHGACLSGSTISHVKMPK
jgi:preprotein translocase subunit SecA